MANDRSGLPYGRPGLREATGKARDFDERRRSSGAPPLWRFTNLHTANFELQPWELAVVNTSGGAVRATLPLAKLCQGAEIIVKRLTGGSNVVIASRSPELVDTGATATIAGAVTTMTFISDGTRWLRIV